MCNAASRRMVIAANDDVKLINWNRIIFEIKH